ncbi:MAG TPA: hypothetical protein VF601_14045 [Beijerinckiaceae bacterium]|jgi:hypothetical protein
MTGLSRRAFLGAAVTLAATPALAQAGSIVPGTRFSSVAVDVGPLHARRLGDYAEFVRRSLTSELQRAFADRLGGPGPRLVVVVTGVSLNPYVGGGAAPRRGRGGGDSDYLEGEALVVGLRGEVLARHPQLSATPASQGGAWYDPASEQKRTAYLAWHYAQWLRRAI